MRLACFPFVISLFVLVQIEHVSSSRRRKGINVNEMWNNFMARVNQTATGAPSIGRLL